MLQDHVGFAALVQEADNKINKMEGSLTRLLFRTRTPMDPIEVEYFRGFRQGVLYVTSILPEEAKGEFIRALAKSKGVADV
jgi:hypothetical protein